MALNAVDSTGVSQHVIDDMRKWRDWLENKDDRGGYWSRIPFCPSVGTRRDAEYIVQCLRVLLPLEGIEGSHPQKTTVLRLSEAVISDEAIPIFCDFLQQPNANLVGLQLWSLYSSPGHVFPRLVESLHTNTSVKELEIQCIQNALCVSNMLEHKTDLMSLSFVSCRFDIAVILPGLRRQHVHLQKLSFEYCDIGDEGTRLLLEAIGDTNVPSLMDLDLSNNNITALGLRLLAEQLPVVLRGLQKLGLGLNCSLLNDLESTKLFVRQVLLSNGMSLLELYIAYCGKHTPAIIAACENDNCKVQVLDISCICNNLQQRIRDQLIESVPKMNKLGRLVCDPRLFTGDEQSSVLAAFRQNTSIVELTIGHRSNSVETHRLVAPILTRNQCLKHADALLALQPMTQNSIGSKSGLWYMAFAKMAPPPPPSPARIEALTNVGYPGASAIFKILTKRPGLLEKQLRRPGAATAAAASASTFNSNQDSGNDNGESKQKRRRL